MPQRCCRPSLSADETSGGMMPCFMPDLFQHAVRDVQPVEVKPCKLPRQKVYLFTGRQVLVDDDPAGFHHPARSAFRCLKIVIRHLDRKGLCDMFEFSKRDFHYTVWSVWAKYSRLPSTLLPYGSP